MCETPQVRPTYRRIYIHTYSQHARGSRVTCVMLKYVLLGLLDAEPRYGYELKAVFEQFLGGTWPLNIGQVYTALSRLERQGLVECQVVPQDLLPDRKVYALTAKGRDELRAWADDPDDGPVSLRDPFFLKIAVASLTGESPR